MPAPSSATAMTACFLTSSTTTAVTVPTSPCPGCSRSNTPADHDAPKRAAECFRRQCAIDVAGNCRKFSTEPSIQWRRCALLLKGVVPDSDRPRRLKSGRPKAECRRRYAGIPVELAMKSHVGHEDVAVTPTSVPSARIAPRRASPAHPSQVFHPCPEPAERSHR